MASVSGMLHRPVSAIAAVAVAAVSFDLPSIFQNPKPSMPNVEFVSSSTTEPQSWVPSVSISNVSGASFASRAQTSLRDVPGTTPSLMSSSPALLTLYQYAKLAKPAENHGYASVKPSSLTSEEVMYRWHLPQPSAYSASGNSECSSAKSQTVVVLLGWLGAKQKHLNRYAEWYTSRGFHVVTFTFPMADVLSYKVGGKAEQNLDLLAEHLAGCVLEEDGKNLVFHTFSNTGWLTYGVILEKFQKQDPSLMEKVKGCIVDSAPVAAPDPQVWASGFSAAFLKKQSIATKGALTTNDSAIKTSVAAESLMEHKPAVTETALLVVLEKFFEVVLNLPSINRRLSDVLYTLSSEQPKCPQLYIYSSADKVIPAKSVESFIDGQRRAGHQVRACDFVSSPHVDHFRSHPSLYTSQLTTFLEDCVLTCCKDSSKEI